ncbi:MAG: hypothetical protein WC695_02515 [Candidatus Omnitrophota bacterium]
MVLPELRGICFDIAAHLLATCALAAGVYARSRSLFYVALVFSSGVLVDLDHVVDSFIYDKKRFDIKGFFCCAYLRSGKTYIVLHSWELVIGIFIIGVVFSSAGAIIFSAGFAVHLFIDNLQRKNRFFYFLLYRVTRNFDARVLLPEYFPE